MLAELRIENLLLISSAHIELVSGLNAFTGETGAGKSLLVDALNFLLGGRGDPGLVRQGASQAEVSARFLIADRELTDSLAHDLGIIFDPDDSPRKKGSANPPLELVVSRTLPASGRGRAHANGRPIALPALQELGERLLDVHGQHENQSLLRPATRIDILDRYACALPERAEVKRAYGDATIVSQALSDLRRAAQERQGREDMLRFQVKELEEAELDAIEPATLDGEMKLLRGAEKIRSAAEAAITALDGEDGDSASVLVARALKQFSALADSGAEVAALSDRLESILAEIQDGARAASDLAERAKSDPERLADLEQRRENLRTLERKYGRDLIGLRELSAKLHSELQDVEQIDIRTQQREVELSKSVLLLREASEKLSRKRKAAVRDLERRVNRELVDLGLKDARLQITLVANSASAGTVDAGTLLPSELRPAGAENVEILFTANPGVEARPLKECASGGEISRVMLALKGVLARQGGADRLPVVVFDEVDSGVGGRLGAVLGRKLSELATVRQVLCVTHQPQVAAFAERQIKVEKTRSGNAALVKVTTLDGDKRIDELALMLRGNAASTHTREEAAAMLSEAQKLRS